MKKCELCDSPAKMYCESDQAYVCWNCDSNVHGANFLVAKHTRTLLCHVCQSPTPWNGSGPKLGPTISVCNICVGNGEKPNDEDGHDHLHREDDDDEDADDDDVEEDNNDGDHDEENQVVPWSSTPAPPVSSSSTSEECSSKFCNGEDGISESNITFSKKRMRETTKFHSKDHKGHSSSQQNKNAYK